MAPAAKKLLIFFVGGPWAGAFAAGAGRELGHFNRSAVGLDTDARCVIELRTLL